MRGVFSHGSRQVAAYARIMRDGLIKPNPEVIYSRVLAENDLIGYVTSGHQLSINADHSIMQAAGGSPMSFAVPAGEAPAMVLDFGAMHDLYEDSSHREDIIRLAPGLIPKRKQCRLQNHVKVGLESTFSFLIPPFGEEL